jgi:hypothetical protein
MFKPLNDALRYCVSTDGKAVTADTLAAQRTLEDWWTCISVRLLQIVVRAFFFDRRLFTGISHWYQCCANARKWAT